jgi:hypothetical protein
MKLNLLTFVAIIALFPGCVVTSTNPPHDPRQVPPGQLRSEEVHARNAERKAQKEEQKTEKKEAKDKLKAEN